MNCPSRTDDLSSHPDWNQNPTSLNADQTTLADLNGIANLRERREIDSSHGSKEEADTQIGGVDEDYGGNTHLEVQSKPNRATRQQFVSFPSLSDPA